MVKACLTSGRPVLLALTQWFWRDSGLNEKVFPAPLRTQTCRQGRRRDLLDNPWVDDSRLPRAGTKHADADPASGPATRRSRCAGWQSRPGARPHATWAWPTRAGAAARPHKQQYIRVLESLKPPREGAVGVAYVQLLLQARNALVVRALAAPARVLGPNTGQPGLARSGGPSDQHGVPLGHPFAQGLTHDRTALYAARAVVQVFYRVVRVDEVIDVRRNSCEPWRLSIRF